MVVFHIFIIPRHTSCMCSSSVLLTHLCFAHISCLLLYIYAIPSSSIYFTHTYKLTNTDEWFQRKSGKRDAEYKAAAIAMKDEMRDAMMSPQELEAKTRVGECSLYCCELYHTLIDLIWIHVYVCSYITSFIWWLFIYTPHTNNR